MTTGDNARNSSQRDRLVELSVDTAVNNAIHAHIKSEATTFNLHSYVESQASALAARGIPTILPEALGHGREVDSGFA